MRKGGVRRLTRRRSTAASPAAAEERERPSSPFTGASDPVRSLNASLMARYPFLDDSRAVARSRALARVDSPDSPRTFVLTHAEGAEGCDLPRLAERPRAHTASLPEEVSWAGGPRGGSALRRGATPLPRVATLPHRSQRQSRAGARSVDASVEDVSRPALRASTPFGVSLGDKPASAHDYVRTRLTMLRSDKSLCDQFFRDVAEQKAEAARELKDRAAVMCSPERTGVCATPAFRDGQRSARRAHREQHAAEVHSRREEHEAATMERKLQVAEAGYRDRIAARSALTRSEREAARAAAWAQLLVGCFIVPVCVRNTLTRHAARSPAANRSVDDLADLRASVSALMCLQRWWRRVVFRIKWKRQLRAAATLRHYFASMDRIKVKFAVALHRLRQQIVRLQTHWRTVILCRSLRREQAKQLVQRAIERECAAVEKTVDKLFKQRASLEEQMRVAIKARKAVFEAQLRDNGAKVDAVVRRRTYLRALTPESFEKLWLQPLQVREAAFAQAMLEYGSVLGQRYLEEQETSREARSRGAGAELDAKARALYHLRRMGYQRVRGPQPPYYPLCISAEEARAIVRVRGIALGTLDTIASMSVGTDTAGPQVLEDAATIFPEVHLQPSLAPLDAPTTMNVRRRSTVAGLS